MTFVVALFLSLLTVIYPSLLKAGSVLERTPIVEITNRPKCKNKKNTCKIEFKVKCVEDCVGAEPGDLECDLEGKKFSVIMNKPKDFLAKGDLVMLHYEVGCGEDSPCSKPEWNYLKKDKCKTVESAGLPSGSKPHEFEILDLKKDSVWEKLGLKQGDVITECLAIRTEASIKKEDCLDFFNDKGRSPDIQTVLIKYLRGNIPRRLHIDFK